MEEFEKENSRFTEKIFSKNHEIYSFSLSNIVHNGTQSSTLMFLFQNKKGLNEEEFAEEVLKYEENYIVENSHFRLQKCLPKWGNQNFLNENIKEEEINKNGNGNGNGNNDIIESNLMDIDDGEAYEKEKENILSSNEIQSVLNKDLDLNDNKESHNLGMFFFEFFLIFFIRYR